jgi:hypothetical protein
MEVIRKLPISKSVFQAIPKVAMGAEPQRIYFYANAHS